MSKSDPDSAVFNGRFERRRRKVLGPAPSSSFSIFEKCFARSDTPDRRTIVVLSDKIFSIENAQGTEFQFAIYEQSLPLSPHVVILDVDISTVQSGLIDTALAQTAAALSDCPANITYRRQQRVATRKFNSGERKIDKQIQDIDVHMAS